MFNDLFLLFPDQTEDSSSSKTPLFQMVGDGDSTLDIIIPLVFLFSNEGAFLTTALEEFHNVDVLLLPKERELGKGTQKNTKITNKHWINQLNRYRTRTVMLNVLKIIKINARNKHLDICTTELERQTVHKYKDGMILP